MVFRNIPEPRNARITWAWVAMRKIAPFFANHWAVILEIDHGKYYVNAQKDKKDSNGDNIHLDYFYSKKSASEATFKYGYNSAIRLSDYGKCDYSWEKFYKDLGPADGYYLIFADCQNFCRKIIYQVTINNKWVLPYPLEDDNVYNNKFPTNDQMANEINKIDNPVGKVAVGTLVFANPVYWIAKGIFSLFD